MSTARHIALIKMADLLFEAAAAKLAQAQQRADELQRALAALEPLPSAESMAMTAAAGQHFRYEQWISQRRAALRRELAAQQVVCASLRGEARRALVRGQTIARLNVAGRTLG